MKKTIMHDVLKSGVHNSWVGPLFKRGNQLELLDVVKILFLATLITFGLKKWWESGFWLPKWLHFVAFLMFLVGIGLAKLAALSGHPKAELHRWLAVGFPLSVYIIFVVYGGASAYVRRIGKHVEYHASMKRDDVLEVFSEHMSKYINLPISNILAIGESGDSIEIRKGNRKYRLFIKSTKVENEKESYIPLGFWLEDHTKNRKYVPLAFAQIVYSLDGEILVNPLEDIELTKPSSGRANRARR